MGARAATEREWSIRSRVEHRSERRASRRVQITDRDALHRHGESRTERTLRVPERFRTGKESDSRNLRAAELLPEKHRAKLELFAECVDVVRAGSRRWLDDQTHRVV